MEGLSLLFSILCIVLLLIYMYVLWQRHKVIQKVLILSLSMVMFQSHVYHIIFGEQLAGEQCDGVEEDVVFGYMKCAEWTTRFLFDTYEITVAWSIVLMASLMFVYVPPKRIFSFTLLVLTVCLSLLLFVLPLNTMQFYVIPYNIASSLLAFGLLIDELYQIWNQNDYSALEKREDNNVVVV